MNEQQRPSLKKPFEQYLGTMVELDKIVDMKPSQIIDLRDQERATGEGMPEPKVIPQIPR